MEGYADTREGDDLIDFTDRAGIIDSSEIGSFPWEMAMKDFFPRWGSAFLAASLLAREMT